MIALSSQVQARVLPEAECIPVVYSGTQKITSGWIGTHQIPVWWTWPESLFTSCPPWAFINQRSSESPCIHIGSAFLATYLRSSGEKLENVNHVCLWWYCSVTSQKLGLHLIDQWALDPYTVSGNQTWMLDEGPNFSRWPLTSAAYQPANLLLLWYHLNTILVNYTSLWFLEGH